MDNTGIQGNYDFQLSYAHDADTDSRLPSIFTVLQEQLGLKLEPAKVPLEILVIYRAEKVPAENLSLRADPSDMYAWTNGASPDLNPTSL